MARTKKTRKISCVPICQLFGPVISGGNTEVIELGIDEFEAIRLYDYGNVTMIEAAKKMKISAPTFCRILKSANRKVADVLMNNKTLKICTQQCN